MPNLDGGHYFLTTLIPVRTDLVDDGGVTSHVHALRSYLARLPTARQSRATEHQTRNAPFARSDRTHFARLVLLDDVAFNGRVPRDAVLSALGEDALTTPQKVDHLRCPFLIFVADFDPTSDAEPITYLMHLWSVMENEWRAILAHCVSGTSVDDAVGFASYLGRCQVETTMPFNDYGIDGPPPAKGRLLPLLSRIFSSNAVLIAAAVAVPFIAALIGFKASAWIAAALVLIALAAYAFVILRARRPFPRAPDSDLRSVLKALYLQQAFTRFAIEHQMDDDATRHAAFAAFLATHRPNDIAGPTQAPGVIRA